MEGAQTFPIKWFLLGLLIFAVAILLEAWRQSRKARHRGKKPTGRASFMGTGMLELQGHLQPDRKIEYIKEDMRDKDRVNPAYRMGSVADKKPDEE